MKFSYNWLNEFVDIPCDVDALAERLSLTGLEVEDIQYIGKDLCHVTTGKIEKIEKHPDADRLIICQLSDGTKTHQIVTAATNVFEGAIVPMSLPGAILENGLKIKPTKMRGVPSNGMLCSEVELGLSDESQGIMILPENTPLGVDFVDYATLKDALLDVAILPNRGDCQSIYGLAREISTLFNIPLKPINTNVKCDTSQSPLKIDVDSPDLCPIYTARVIKNITHNESPDWMKRRLSVSGIRPINLIVDVTNYVLLEMVAPASS